jgi:serine/threonine protein kinase
MAELFNETPLFPGSSELDQIDTILRQLGTPKFEQWREGYKLAQKRKINLEDMQYKKQSMKALVPRASTEALAMLKLMFKINPKKRPTAS